MHVLMTVNAAWNVWNFRRSLVRAILEDGHRITILAPPDQTISQLQAMGCSFYPLAMSTKGVNPFEGISLTYRIWRAIQIERPDIILGYTIKNNIFGAFAAKMTSIPFVPNITGLGTAFLSNGLLERLAETLYRQAFRGLPIVFFQNPDDRDLFIERGLISPEQARVLPGSGVNLKYFTPAPEPPEDSPPTFLMIARLLRDKGVFEYVDAARTLRSRHPTVRFQLLGPIDTTNRTAIDRTTLDEWIAEGIIEYLGTTSDVRPYIAAAHCIVLPSYREGAPRTLIEAAAMARPLIASNVPGCRSVIRDGQTGFLCPPRDATGLVNAVERFLALDPKQRAAMGAAGRVFMERTYGEEIVIAAYRRALAELVPG